MPALRLVIFTMLLAPSFAATAFSQTMTPSPQPTPTTISPEAAHGIGLYRQGNMSAAIEALRAVTRRNGSDADAWYYLGLALNRANETRDARRAFERAVRLRPDFAAARTGWAYTFLAENKLREAEREVRRAVQLNARDAEAHYIFGIISYRRENFSAALDEARVALEINPNFAPAHLLRSHALQAVAADIRTDIPSNDIEATERRRITENRQRLTEAAESLERYLALDPRATNIEELREQLEALRLYARTSNGADSERTIYSSSEVTTRVRITSKSEPLYTEDARQAGVRGRVVLRALFTADGQVIYITPVRRLSHGLTEASIQVARQIRFEPATINGRPVSTFITLEYEFMMY